MSKQAIIGASIAVGFAAGAAYHSRLVRGIRNNNPLNIEYNRFNAWDGQVGSDGRFCIFQNPVYGFRAAAKVLRSYNRQGYRTLSQVITRFAPSHENDTQNYINSVSKWSGVKPNQVVPVYDNAALAKVLLSMSRMEVGKYFAYEAALKGVELA